MYCGSSCDCELRGGRQISARWKDFACSSTVLSGVSKDLEIELPESKEENVTLKGDYVLQVVEIVIGGIPTILEFRFKCMFGSLGRSLLQGFISTNLFDPMWHEVCFHTVEVGIGLLGSVHLIADIIPPCFHIAPHLHRHPCCSICFFV